ncbi:odorant receptor 63a [Drosophila kikkawai]|uniref:Odorant receptor n=1 Tax=Drosophila kikkawai TaxID=30033 RepID=A0A6P4IK22_DROKI|nr:odorant receptor 63a [Drosophila kikkawai]
MYSPEEARALERRNYHSIREMIWLSYTVGFNLMEPHPSRLRIWTVVLSLSSLASLYGHWHMLLKYINEIPRIVETAGTALQFLSSIFKMWYYLFTHRRIYELLRKARCHELLQNCEIFTEMSDLPVVKTLRQQVETTMERYWANTRRILLIFLYSCATLTSTYFLRSFLTSLYQYFFLPAGSFDIVLPFESLYPSWKGKGMTFPYFHIQMYIETCSLYICGMAAVSFDGVFIVLCLHSVGLIRSLNQMIGYSTTELVPRERRVQYLRCCIYQYQRIHSFAAEINAYFRQITFSQFLLSLFVWGLALFQLSVGLNSSFTIILMSMYLLAAGYQIVVYCYNGQRFANASSQIGRAFYECEWYGESREFRQLIGMMLMRTNRDFRLDVSWFMQMSLPTLMAMVRTSGQYFLLLQNVTQK